MPMVTCSSGCGHEVEVSQQAIVDALTAGKLVFSHDVCPGQKELTNEYRVDVTVSRILFPGTDYEQPMKLAATGSSVHGTSLVDVFPDLHDELQVNLLKLVTVIPTAEEGIEEEIERLRQEYETDEGRV